MKWYLIHTSYACAGVGIRGGIVVSAAPIFQWMLGKQWSNVKKWRKITKVEVVDENIIEEDNQQYGDLQRG